MNFNIEGPSHLQYSTSSSNSDSENDDEVQLLNALEGFDAKAEVIIRMNDNNNHIIAHYLVQQNNQVAHGDSIPGHRVINRDRESADRNIFNEYFVENLRYPDLMFRGRFRMGRSIFLRIFNTMAGHDNYFMQRRDELGRLGLSGLQKMTAMFRMLACGIAADATDEYIKIRKYTAIQSLKKFCRAVVEVFLEQYLRSPNANDVARLLHIGKHRDFLGMLGSLDCMHWKWKNSPTDWVGQYASCSGSPTIILETVADYDLWIWHAYFGLPGSNNDINVLKASYLFANLAEGAARFWNKNILHDIITACIIIHNMIIEDERDVDVAIKDWMEAPTPEIKIVVDENTRFQEFLARHRQIKDRKTHIALRNILIDHLWGGIY